MVARRRCRDPALFRPSIGSSLLRGQEQASKTLRRSFSGMRSQMRLTRCPPGQEWRQRLRYPDNRESIEYERSCTNQENQSSIDAAPISKRLVLSDPAKVDRPMMEPQPLKRRLRGLRDDRASGAVGLALQALGIANDWIAAGRACRRPRRARSARPKNFGGFSSG